MRPISFSFDVVAIFAAVFGTAFSQSPLDIEVRDIEEEDELSIEDASQDSNKQVYPHGIVPCPCSSKSN